jgi:uncharacterized protein (DUF1778 family)
MGQNDEPRRFLIEHARRTIIDRAARVHHREVTQCVLTTRTRTQIAAVDEIVWNTESQLRNLVNRLSKSPAANGVRRIRRTPPQWLSPWLSVHVRLTIGDGLPTPLTRSRSEFVDRSFRVLQISACVVSSERSVYLCEVERSPCGRSGRNQLC